MFTFELDDFHFIEYINICIGQKSTKKIFTLKYIYADCYCLWNGFFSV